MLEKDLKINSSSKTNNFLYFIIKILILEDYLSVTELKKQVNLNELEYLFSEVNLSKLYQIIKVQKLAVLINKSIFLKENMPSSFNKTIENFTSVPRKKCLESMALICVIYKILKNKGIEVLFFKGPILSIQTTGSIFSRGFSKDIDILVKYKDFIRVIKILFKKGFKVKKNSEIFIKNDLLGWYSRKVVNQVTLFKDFSNQTLHIDLHWELSFIRNKLPSQESIFNNKDFVSFNNIEIPTLNKKNALIHTYIHNGIDDWNKIRGIIDFFRLIVINDEAFIRELRNDKLFIDSCLYSYFLLDLPQINKIIQKNLKPSFKKPYINKFNSKDLSEIKLISKSKWSFKKRYIIIKRHLKLTNNLGEMIRILLNNLFPPKDFWSNSSQRFYFIHEIIIFRIKKLYMRLLNEYK